MCLGSLLASNSGSALERVVAGGPLRDGAARWNGPGEPHVAADARAPPDGDTAEDRGARVDRDVVFDDRMAWPAFDRPSALVGRETLRAERHALVEAHPLADDASLPDHDAGSVVDEEAPAD